MLTIRHVLKSERPLPMQRRQLNAKAEWERVSYERDS